MEDLTWWLRLNNLGFAPRKTKDLLRVGGGPAEVFASAVYRLKAVPGLTASDIDKIRRTATLDTQADEKRMSELGIRAIPFDDADYPPRLKETFDPPPLLFVRGDLLAADAIAVAIVGTRTASAYGKVVAERLSGDLARRGVTVVSGLARGIDAVAHQAAIAAGGRTLAVFGCGVDVIYPREHRPLTEQIVAHGALLSEFPVSTQPEPWHFPARNRVISALSLGTLVVEAPENSGALITADFALEQGREVFAVPGNVNSGKSKGCHRLIKEGAKLVEDVEDILSELPIKTHPEAPQAANACQLQLPFSLTDLERRVYDALDYGERHIDELIRESGLSSAEATSTLMLLEIKGLARRCPGGLFMRLR